MLQEVAGEKPIDILLVEDNIADVRLTQEAFKEADLSLNLHTALDGEEALNFLYKRAEFESACRPDLIILDINLPKLRGNEVLAVVKDDPDLRRIPVVRLSSSESEQDIIESYNLQANCYIQKPLDMDSFVQVVKSIKDYWFSLVKLPSP